MTRGRRHAVSLALALAAVLAGTATAAGTASAAISYPGPGWGTVAAETGITFRGVPDGRSRIVAVP